jgi:hypothetical protein
MTVRTQNKQIYTKITGLLQDRFGSLTLNRQGLVYANATGAHFLRKRAGLRRSKRNSCARSSRKVWS